MKSNSNTPIFITGAERSGSSFIARILNLSGAYVGNRNKMYENIELNKILFEILENERKALILPETSELAIIPDFKHIILTELRKSQESTLKWLYKNAHLSLLWPIWHISFPQAKWIIVRRKPADIINSCCKTGYMKLMKDQKLLDLLELKTEEEGWNWLIHQHELRWQEMIKAGLSIKEVWPDRMENNDYSQIQEIVEWIGLEWNQEKIESVMQPIFMKQKKGNK
jgi:hypothetical protein